MSYHLAYSPEGTPVVIRDADGASIPPGSDNADWRAFLAWNAGEAAPLAYAAARAVPPTGLPVRLDALGVSGRLLAALAFRLSASWASATPAQQQAAQAILDSAGGGVLGVLQAAGV